jgi:TM2 domain-containing membrane protein YozV
MYCKNCGKEMSEQADVCVNCGTSAQKGDSYCCNCGAEMSQGADYCVKCGKAVKAAPKTGEKSKIAAGLLALFFGGLGVHDFYLGYTGRGIAKICLVLGSLLTLGLTGIACSAWVIVDIVKIFTGKAKDSKGNALCD